MIADNTIDVLDFPKVLALIAGYAHSEPTVAGVHALRPFESREDAERRLRLIADIRKLAHEGAPLRFMRFGDISPHLANIRPEGSVLDAKELADFVPFLQIASSIKEAVHGRTDVPHLREFVGSLTGFPHILGRLETSIDADGNILDSASFLLADLRSQIRKLEGKIKKRLDEIARDERIAPFLQDDFVTTRSGRWVIPVRMDSKGMVPGVVHDVSKSGETAFIEPLSIIHLSNELENLIADQKAEELRILRELCATIRNVIDDISREFGIVVSLDVMWSVAQFADSLGMENPALTETGRLFLSGARHPLLEISLAKTTPRRHVVPLDVALGGEDTVMVITGANAGGKTIALKTIGLVIVMALSGLPVPAHSSSSIPFTTHLLVDIGDEQSIENNLSTFSAHVENVAAILKQREFGTIVLIDELGTGTDPDEGAALACAILKELRKSGALVFATTHLSEIKGFVHTSEGMVNASMEFDRQTFTPLYRLKIGEPGQSHALDIALRYGIPEAIIEDARKMLGSTKVDLDRMIADLHRAKEEHERARRDLETSLSAAAEQRRALDRALAEAREREKKVLSDAYREASEIIANAKREMRAILDEARLKERAERRKALKKIAEAGAIVEGKLRELEPESVHNLSLEEIRKGDVLYVRSLGVQARVSEVDARNARVRVTAGNVEAEVPLADIAFATKPESGDARQNGYSVGNEAPVLMKLHLVGQRVDEALSRLERFLNDASLSDLPEVLIVHGVGKGILSKAVHEHLSAHPLVKGYRRGTREEGGAGVTVVTMK